MYVHTLYVCWYAFPSNKTHSNYFLNTLPHVLPYIFSQIYEEIYINIIKNMTVTHSKWPKNLLIWEKMYVNPCGNVRENALKVW